MKNIKTPIVVLLLFALCITASSCVVLTRHDNGKHKGWYKNSGKSHPSSSRSSRGKH